MSGSLPKTGLGTVTVAIGGATYHPNIVTISVAVGVTLLVVGAGLLRFGFRRRMAPGK